MQPQTQAANPALADVKTIIAVASGKGGVGKSTVASNLAIALVQKGLATGLMDADIYGPSLPMMMGLSAIEPVAGAFPVEKYGLKLMSMGFIPDATKGVLLRGPMGHVGISVAVAGSSAVQMVLLFVALKRRLGTLHFAEIAASAARTLAASAVAASAALGTAHVFEDGPRLGAMARALPGALASVVFVALFALSAFVLGSGELKGLLAGIRGRLRRRRARSDA